MCAPKFSIITISYNSSRTIERTIKSVFSQSFIDYEYIIVDGASSDGTCEIIARYEPLFNGKLHWISEPDNGIYNAMNKGIHRAVGRIIGIVNSDDWLEPDALENVNLALEKNNQNENAIYSGGVMFHSLSGWTKKLMPSLSLLDKSVSKYVMSGIRHPATFVPLNVYHKYGVYDERIKISADQDFILRCYYQGVPIAPIYNVLSNMADGGVSNITYFGLSHQEALDRKLILSKYEMSNIRRWLLFQYVNVRMCIKFIFKKMKVYRIH